MTGGQVHVEPDALDAAAARQKSCAEAVQRCAEKLRAVVTTGNAFGVLGEMTGTRASYDEWTNYEAQSLAELTRCLGDMAEGLRQTAQSYRDADQAGYDVVNSAYPGGVSV